MPPKPIEMDKIDHTKQEMESEWLNEDNAGVTTRIFRNCLSSMRLLIQLSEPKLESKLATTALIRCYQTLNLLAHGHGVYDGTLDEVFHRSRGLQQTTLWILNPMCKVLLDALDTFLPAKTNGISIIILLRRPTAAKLYSQTKRLLMQAGNEEDEEEDFSDDDSVVSGDRPNANLLSNIVEDIKVYTTCLVDLGASFECPATDHERTEERMGFIDEQRLTYDYHAETISAMYPAADHDLVKCLGKTNWNRYQRMQRERKTNNIGESDTSSTIKSQLAESKFIDSVLGSSMPPVPSSYAEKIVSYKTDTTGEQHVQMPLLSAEVKSGERVECNACGKSVSVKSSLDWRNHLFGDLQPYTCFFTGCTFSETIFAERQQWSDHLELDHNFGPVWASVECALCLESTENGKTAILSHFARHLEDIALTALPREVESGNRSGDTSEHDSKAGSTQELYSDQQALSEYGSDQSNTPSPKSMENIETIIPYGGGPSNENALNWSIDWLDRVNNDDAALREPWSTGNIKISLQSHRTTSQSDESRTEERSAVLPESGTHPSQLPGVTNLSGTYASLQEPTYALDEDVTKPIVEAPATEDECGHCLLPERLCTCSDLPSNTARFLQRPLYSLDKSRRGERSTILQESGVHPLTASRYVHSKPYPEDLPTLESYPRVTSEEDARVLASEEAEHTGSPSLVNETGSLIEETPVVADPLKCNHPGCGKKYTGPNRQGNLGIHNRHIHHMDEERYICGVDGCMSKF